MDTITVNIGDRVVWGGSFITGKESGVNTVTRLFDEGGFQWMELDNGKQFIVKDLANPNKKRERSWKKLNLDGL